MLLETGGGLFKARAFFDDKPFLIYNADIILIWICRLYTNIILEKKDLPLLQ